MQLEMFVAVVEEGSVRRAAERVLRTQPAVSIAISKLELEFEASLFDRSKRHEYRLTPVGETLYEYAKRMLGLRRQALSAINDVRNLRLGRVRIGANESISLHVLPRMAQSFLKTHPRIRMEVKCERSKTLLADLKERRLDLVLLSFRPDDGEVEAKFVLQDELVLITAAGHPLSRKGTISIEDLCEESIFVMDVSEPSPWHQKISEAFVRCKTQLHMTVENAPIETIKRMVGIGLGVAFVPKLAVREEEARGELAVVEVDGLRVERSVWLVRRRALQSPAAKEFVQTALAFGEQLRATNCASLEAPARPSLAKSAKVVMVKRQA
jgi:DNA-binding transcriptional LysR family regulator